MVRTVDWWRLPHLSSAGEWVETDLSTVCKPFPSPISCLCLQHQHMALGLVTPRPGISCVLWGGEQPLWALPS